MGEAARSVLAADQLRIGSLTLRRSFALQGLVVFSVVTSVGFAEGGLLPRTWRLATVALLALAGAALVSRARITLGSLDLSTLAAFAALAGWTALSAAWSSEPTVSLLQAERVLVYAAGLFAFVLLAERAAVPHLLIGALAGITVLAAYGLTRYVVAPPPLDPFEGRLLYQPFGYANALGIVAAIGILLASGLAQWAHGSARAVALAPIAVLGPSLYYTSSRGAWLALGAGFVVFVALRGGRVVAWASTAGLAAAAIVAGVVLASSHDLALSRFAGHDRAQYWHVALKDSEEHPVLGAGAGTYGDYWLRHRPVRTFTRTAHSLYLQSLAELGPVGLLLVVASLGVPLVAVRRQRDPLAAAAAAAYVAYVLHTGIDWDWELPAVTLAGLCCGAVVLLTGRGEVAREIGPRGRTALLVALLVVAVAELVRLVTGPTTPLGI